jgi:WD40 repeat protein
LCTQTLHTLQGHFGAVKAAAWSPSADQIVSGGSDTLLRVWNVANGSELHRIEGHRGTINAAVWSSDGTRIISGSEDRTVRIWDSESGRQLNLFPTGSPVQSLAATMDASGQLQIVAGLDSGALIWLELCHSKQEKKVE